MPKPINCKHAHTSFELLLCIATEPIIARYIVYGDFTDDRSDYVTGDTRFDESFPHSNDDSSHDSSSESERTSDEGQKAREQTRISGEQAILALLCQSHYVQEACLNSIYNTDASFESDPQTLLDLILHEHHNESETNYFTGTFLLTLLPNVRSLALPSSWNSIYADPDLPQNNRAKVTWALLDTMVRRARLFSGSNRHSPLLALSNLETFYTKIDLKHYGLQTIAPFLSMPRLNTICAYHCSDKVSGVRGNFSNRYSSNFASSLENLEMTSGHITSAGISELLEPFKSLKRLSFSCIYSVGRFLKAVEAAVGPTLEELSLRISAHPDAWTDLTFAGFERLRELELDIHVFWSLNEARSGLAEKEGPGPKSLQRLLPPSIERVVLLVGSDDHHIQQGHLDCYKWLFPIHQHLDQDSVKLRLPRLKNIVVRESRWGTNLNAAYKLRQSGDERIRSGMMEATNAGGEQLVKFEMVNDGVLVLDSVRKRFQKKGLPRLFAMHRPFLRNRGVESYT